MQFIQASYQEIDKIIELAQKIWRDHYPSIIGEEQVEFMLAKMYDKASLEKQIQKGDEFYLAFDESENRYLGFVSIKNEGESKLFINKFYIDTNHQRFGIGLLFFDFILREYVPQEIRLQVNRQNFKAINFYFKAGFKIEKVADFDIGDGYFMNDFIMIWESLEKRSVKRV